MLMPALLLGMLLHAQTGANTAAAFPVDKAVEFKETDHDFGKIPQGKPVEFDLYMKNISADSLKIDKVDVVCGCTTPKYEAGKPYAPGESFKITVGYNASAMGPFAKMITIHFAGGMDKIIRFHGETFTAPANAAPTNAAVQQLKPASSSN